MNKIVNIRFGDKHIKRDCTLGVAESQKGSKWEQVGVNHDLREHFICIVVWRFYGRIARKAALKSCEKLFKFIRRYGDISHSYIQKTPLSLPRFYSGGKS